MYMCNMSVCWFEQAGRQAGRQADRKAGRQSVM